jgi:acyl carrier protein
MNIRGMWDKLREALGTENRLREQSKLWASRHFPGAREDVAATAAWIIVRQLGMTFDLLQPSSHFIRDLQMSDFEPEELVMALEEKFKFKIPTSECSHLFTVAELVDYLYQKTQFSRKSGS